MSHTTPDSSTDDSLYAATPPRSGVRLGTLIWGLIALLVALWSLSTVLLDWTPDPVLMGIGLAGLVGIALIGGGIAGAARQRD
ncbi:hypothetical protein [Micrococcus terreus]|uniref:Uncharacterized protein n=2 Tax=Micrococcus terreus TaxID=574650 RepID=A0A1I7MDV2_9MICC|nr:hypothetical protein [Micrococcus terreus]SFV20087.1 hypothetical protein SAMN04487966_101103 [Micrococcus terreus]